MTGAQLVNGTIVGIAGAVAGWSWLFLRRPRRRGPEPLFSVPLAASLAAAIGIGVVSLRFTISSSPPTRLELAFVQLARLGGLVALGLWMRALDISRRR